MRASLAADLKSLFLLVALAALGGCEEATGPQFLPTGVEIRTADKFLIETAGTSRKVTISGTVVNDSRWILVVNYCGYSLARGGPTGWSDVWTQSCAAVDGVPVEVPPGSDLDFAVTVTQTSSLDLDGGAEVYRLRVPMFLKSAVPFGEKAFALEPDARLSSAFSLEGPTVPPGTSPAP